MRASPLLPEQAVIKDARNQTYDTITFTMSFMNGRQAEYRFAPGQYNMVTLFGIGEAPFSISSDPGKTDSFDHTIRVVGNLTMALRRLNVGDVVGVRGPYGKGWPLEEAAGKDILIVAGGIGLAPLRPVISEILSNRDRYGQVEILYGARTPEDLLFVDEVDRWRAVPSCSVSVSVDSVPEDQRWNGHVGVVTTLYKEMRTKPRNAVVMMCGPQIMMKFGLIGLLKDGFPDSRIYISLERRMKCGVGMCGHCQTGPLHVCKDGPVFPYSRIKALPLPVL